MRGRCEEVFDEIFLPRRHAEAPLATSTLTAVDRDNNRIEIELLPGTITDEKKIMNGSGFPPRTTFPLTLNSRRIGWPTG